MLFVSHITASELGVLKLSLLRTEYLSSADSMLTNSLKILHVTKIQFFQVQFLSH